MDQVREALTLVAADVDRSHLGTPDAIRSRGERNRRRERVLGVEVAVGVATLAFALLVMTHAVTRQTPTPLNSPTPSPSLSSSSSPTQSPTAGSSLVVLPGACGFARACPDVSGTVQKVLVTDPGPDQLWMSLAVPVGWQVRETMGSAVRVVDPQGSYGVAAVWPVQGFSGSASARSLAGTLARLPGSAATSPQQVEVDGHVGWRVSFDHTRSGSTQSCIDPRLSILSGVKLHGVRCRPLFDLATENGVSPTEHTTIGLGPGGQTEITLVDDLGVGGKAGVLSLWRWGKDLSSDTHGSSALASIRLGSYADPSCGAIDLRVRPDCRSTHGQYVVRGDPDVTGTGIRHWRAWATIRVPDGWSLNSDDGVGTASMGDSLGQASALVVWAVPNGSGPLTGRARSWAMQVSHRAGVHATDPLLVHVGGRLAWRVDVSPDKTAPAFRQAATPRQDSRCGPNGWYYAIALVCVPHEVVEPGSTSVTNLGLYLEGDAAERLWFVQVDSQHVFVIAATAKLIKGFVPPILPALIRTTQPIIDSVIFDVG